MRDILLLAQELRDTELYRDLQTAEKIGRAFSRGMLPLGEVDLLRIIGPCFDLRSYREGGEASEELKKAYGEYACRLLREIDQAAPVERSVWLLLGKALYENRFTILDQFPVRAVCEEGGGETVPLVFRDREYCDRLSSRYDLTTTLTDPRAYTEAAEYIRRRGSAAHVVRRWLLADMEALYGEKKAPEFPPEAALFFVKAPDARFPADWTPGRLIRPGDRFTLGLVDETQIPFEPEAECRGVYNYPTHREIRGTAWYRNDLWLLRILLNVDGFGERVMRYRLCSQEYRGFHVRSFIVRGGNYRQWDRDQLPGRTVRVELMDLLGADVDLDMTVSEAFPGGVTGTAPFPDSVTRKLSLYVAKDTGYDGDRAIVELSEGYRPGVL